MIMIIQSTVLSKSERILYRNCCQQTLERAKDARTCQQFDRFIYFISVAKYAYAETTL